MKKYLDTYLELIKEFNYEKNFPLKPKDFTRGSGKKIWWVCIKNKSHTWKATVYSRTKIRRLKNGKIYIGTSCPFCCGRILNEKNNLKFLMPQLAKEWHPVKNNNLKPEVFTKFSNEKVWWLCSKNHEWKTGINNRSNGTRCPYCK